MFTALQTVCFRAVNDVVETTLRVLRPLVIKMPRGQQELLRINAKWLRRQTWLLGAVLAVDGLLLPIEKPQVDSADYFCRKDFYALNWLLACDSDLIVRYLYGAFPGSAQDSRAANKSDLFDRLIELEPFFAVGDNGFALRRYMQVPIKGQVSKAQRAYNHAISSVRIDQEYANFP
jgi:hypothetical protein